VSGDEQRDEIRGTVLRGIGFGQEPSAAKAGVLGDELIDRARAVVAAYYRNGTTPRAGVPRSLRGAIQRLEELVGRP
jgi:hypothetical protein